MRIPAWRLAAAIALSVLLVACAPTGPLIKATGNVVNTTVARVTANTDAAGRGATGVRAFAGDIYRDLAKRSGNVVFSPYSIAVALAMTRAGAAGETAAQMDTVLHADQVGDLDAAFNAIDQALAKRPGTYDVGQQKIPLELATANRLWGQKDFEFSRTFLDRLSAYYGAGVGIVDYVNAREAARAAINQWVSDRTKARIPELIKEGVLNELTVLVLTNAVYMKARWEHPFEPTATKAAPFHGLDGRDTQVQLMRGAADSYAYTKGAGYQAVRLPYVKGLSMTVLLPDAGAFGSFESSLDGPRLDQIRAAMTQKQVVVSLPRFEFRMATSLKDTLARLGMPIAFTDGADLSGITPNTKLLIQDVVHEAFISVDEKGTEAAAATAVVVGRTSAPTDLVEFTVDRPFVFLITDDETGVILFMGRVLDPTA